MFGVENSKQTKSFPERIHTTIPTSTIRIRHSRRWKYHTFILSVWEMVQPRGLEFLWFSLLRCVFLLARKPSLVNSIPKLFDHLRSFGKKKIMVKVIRLLTYKSIIALQLANYNVHPQIQQTFLQNQREHIRLTSCFHAGPSPWRRTKRRILRYKLNLLRSGHWQVKLLENALCFGWCNVFLQVFYKHISIGL